MKSAPKRTRFSTFTSEEPVVPTSNRFEDQMEALFLGRCRMLLPFVAQIEEPVNEFLINYLKGLKKYSTKSERKQKLASPTYIPKDIAFKFKLKSTATYAENEGFKQEVEFVEARISEFQNDLKRSMLRVTEQEIVECKEELSTLVVNFLRNCMESYLIINEQAESSSMVNFQVLISNVIEDIYVSKQAESIFCTMKPSLIPNPVEDGFRFQENSNLPEDRKALHDELLDLFGQLARDAILFVVAEYACNQKRNVIELDLRRHQKEKKLIETTEKTALEFDTVMAGMDEESFRNIVSREVESKLKESRDAKNKSRGVNSGKNNDASLKNKNNKKKDKKKVVRFQDQSAGNQNTTRGQEGDSSGNSSKHKGRRKNENDKKKIGKKKNGKKN